MKIKLQNIPENRTDHELTVEISEESLSVLISYLGHLKSGKIDHAHLFSDEWGGDDFTNDGTELKIAHIKIELEQNK